MPPGLASEFDSLAKSVAQMTPDQQAELALGVERAAAAAEDDPQLAEALVKAAAALRIGKAADAGDALREAGSRS